MHKYLDKGRQALPIQTEDIQPSLSRWRYLPLLILLSVVTLTALGIIGNFTVAEAQEPNTDEGVHGMKFHDLNGDGQKDPNEPGLEGWTIVIKATNGFSRETRTDENGHYWFMDIPDGEYTLFEELEPGWIQTHPVSEVYTFGYVQNQPITGLDFGNWAPGYSIHGMKFHDLNKNGQKDEGEPGLPGWKIFVEGTGIGRYTYTDRHGNYWFVGLEAGTYWVGENFRDGWEQTFPDLSGTFQGGHVIDLSPNNEKAEDVDFGNWRAASIHGTKWYDANGNGVREADEHGLKDWTIILSGLNNNTQLTTTTDEHGHYWFVGLPVGEYNVSENVQQGWQQTYPLNPSHHEIDLDAGETVHDIDFGNTQPGGIHGQKFYDRNGNGQKDPGEPGIPGWTIILTGVDGSIRTEETNERGRYWFTDVTTGSYSVTEELKSGWEQTFPPFGAHTFNFNAEQPLGGLDFGNWMPDADGIHGVKYYDLNGNGQRDDDEHGLPGWVIVLTGQTQSGEQIELETVTDEDGHYWFTQLPAGTYVIREIQKDGWQQTAPTTFSYQVPYDENQVIENLDFGNWRPSYGSIHGRKFFDENGNGQWDQGEPPLQNWKIVLEGRDFFRETFTDHEGRYWFMDLPEGDYFVFERQEPGWEQTYPVSPPFHYVDLPPGHAVHGLHFGNYIPNHNGIHGHKFFDQNGNGVKDANEPGLPGWIIVLEGQSVSGEAVERRTVTNEEGHYWFVNLPEGDYQVREIIYPGWEQTFPPTGHYSLAYDPNQTIDGVDFGNWLSGPGEVHGTKFHDLNGNGHRDANEPGLSGWKIIIERATDDINFRQVTETNQDGHYWFMDVPAGSYHLIEEQQQGWHQTFPQGGTHQVMVAPNEVVDEVDFGNWQPQPGEIHGKKFNDLNGNGEFDDDEPALGGWEIVLEGEHGFHQKMTTDDDGNYWFMGLPPGLYHVAEIHQEGWRQTYPRDPEYHEVTLSQGDVIDGLNFGNRQPGPGKIHGMKFQDTDGDGRKDNNDVGLEGWTIILMQHGNEISRTQTNADGEYLFMELAPGRYFVKEQLQDGWLQTFPANFGGHIIHLEAGDTVDNVNFGNWQPEPGEIHGAKFRDENGNGVRDPNELGLAGWRIVIEGERGVQRETTTDNDGNYEFLNLPPDFYIVREVPDQQPGWYQTFPDSFHFVLLDSGQVIDSLDFGNWQPQPGEIHGKKFHDLNGNGVNDNEPGLEGWTIMLVRRDQVVSTTTTDTDGNYWFKGIRPGRYEVWERQQDGWRQTHPVSPRYHAVDLGSGQVLDGQDFGNWQPAPGSIHGMKFYDLNGNGQREDNEPGLADWKIVLVEEGKRVTYTHTMTDGHYWFTDILPGKYRIYEEIPDDTWQQTTPIKPRYHEVELEPGQTIEGQDFGNWQPTPGSIHGLKFHDLNQNGVQDAGEPGLANWDIVVRSNDTIRHARTNENGEYWIENIAKPTNIPVLDPANPAPP
ncbi:MAG: SdrD B-like domain-containing protein [Chloroflexota bacterium]